MWPWWQCHRLYCRSNFVFLLHTHACSTHSTGSWAHGRGIDQLQQCHDGQFDPAPPQARQKLAQFQGTLSAHITRPEAAAAVTQQCKMGSYLSAWTETLSEACRNPKQQQNAAHSTLSATMQLHHSRLAG